MSRITTSPPPLALRRLPSFPPVATKLLGLLADPKGSFVEATALLRSDAALSAELLRLANSPLFGTQREVTSILQALSLLGIQRIGGLVGTLLTSRLLGGCRQFRAAKQCWRHSLACGCAAEELAEQYGLEADTGYTAGLLHDIGRLGLLASDPDRYASLLEQDGLTEAELSAREDEAFGITHAAAGRYLAERWGLPRTFWEMIGCHHRPAGPQAPLAQLVRQACAAADNAGFSVLNSDCELTDRDFAQRIAIRVNAAELSLV